MTVNKVNKKEREALHKLLDEVINAQNKGYPSFFDFSGHVSWVNISIRSKYDYEVHLYSQDTISWGYERDALTKTVNTIIKEMKQTIKDRKTAQRIAAEQVRKQELKELERLQKKYKQNK